MKTERRHDLETNLLARKLAEYIEQAKPYANTAIIVVGALAVVVVGWVVLRRQAAGQESLAWDDYFLATSDVNINPTKLRETAQKYSESPVAYWANLALADGHLQAGTVALFINKAQAKSSLNDAIAGYRQVVETAGAPQQVLDRARFGLGRAFESLGEVDTARGHYLAVQGTYAPFAKARAESLDRPDTKRFYDWFANAQSSVPPTIGLPGIPGQRPLFDVPSGDTILDSGLLPDFGLGIGDDASTDDASTTDDEAPAADAESPNSEPTPDAPQ